MDKIDVELSAKILAHKLREMNKKTVHKRETKKISTPAEKEALKELDKNSLINKKLRKESKK